MEIKKTRRKYFIPNGLGGSTVFLVSIAMRCFPSY